MSGDDFNNRRSALGWLCGGGLAAAVALAVNQALRAETVDLKTVPKAILDAAGRVAPKATWLSAEKVVEGKSVAYELDGTMGKGRDVTVMVTAEGKVVEVEVELAKADNVPNKVLDAVRKKWPKFTPTETRLIRQGEDLRRVKDGDMIYEMRGTRAKEQTVQVQVKDDGTILEATVQIPLAKVPKVVTDALEKRRKNFRVEAAFVLTEGETVIGYHFEGKGPKGGEKTLSVTPDGKRIELVE